MKNIINYGNSLKSNVNLYKVKNYIKNNKKDNKFKVLHGCNWRT